MYDTKPLIGRYHSILPYSAPTLRREIYAIGPHHLVSLRHVWSGAGSS